MLWVYTVQGVLTLIIQGVVTLYQDQPSLELVHLKF
jgi:hypothetical protein